MPCVMDEIRSRHIELSLRIFMEGVEMILDSILLT